MRIINPLEMNDWGIRKFMVVVLAIHLLMWIAVGLGTLGVHIPVITEVIGFIYLIFIPGVLILRVLRLHELGSIKAPLFSVGLSVAFTMFVGLLTNTIYHLAGISQPLSPVPLIITFSIIVIALCALSYIRDKNYSQPTYIELKDLLAPPALFLLFLLFLSILGASLVRFYDTNIILLSLMVIIAGVVALVALNRFIGREFYPLAIFTVAIALLYHSKLSFSYLWGTDIQVEYYMYMFVEASSYWAPGVPVNIYNAMLSITILPVVWSRLLGMEGLWVFKLLYPILFALLPLGLYKVYQQQTDEKTAFLSVFFFMSFIGFLAEVTTVIKMQIAGLFFVLLIVLILSKELDLTKRVVLFIIFSFSLAVSHYGLGFYYLFYILFAWLFIIFIREVFKEDTRAELLTATSIVLCLVATLSWYMYVSNAIVLEASVTLGQFTWNHVSDLFVLETRDPRLLQGLGLVPVGLLEHSFLRELAGWFNRITYLMIIIGVLRLIVKRRQMRFAPEYIGMALAGLLTMLACIFIPTFSYIALNTGRIYFIALFFLSPFCILGGETIFSGIKRIFQRANKRITEDAIWGNRAHLYIALLVLIPYFLFNVGFIFEVTGDPPSSVVLGLERWKTTTNEEAKAGLYGSYYPVVDVSSIRWLSEHQNDTAPIYCDQSLLYAYGKIGAAYNDLHLVTEIDKEAYIHLRYFNTSDSLMRGVKPIWTAGAGKRWLIYSVAVISPLLEKSSLIYSNGGSEIYYTIPESIHRDSPRE